MGSNGIEDSNNNYPVSVAYTVRKGDTLDKISKASGIPISILVKDNGIKNPDEILIGQPIWLNYHPESWESFNSKEMNEMFPNMNDQAIYFEQMDAETAQKYNQINTMGAQEYVKKFNVKF